MSICISGDRTIETVRRKRALLEDRNMALHRTFRIEPILAGLACSLLFGYGGLADAESVSGISTNRYTDPVVITGNRLRIFDGV